MKNKRLDLRVTEELKKRITEEADKLGISRNQLIEEIIEKHLTN